RSDREPALGDELPDQRLGLRADLEVVVDRGGLTIEREAEPGIRGHPLEQLVDEVDEAHAEHLERLIPLAVPVGVRDEIDDGAIGHAAASPPISTPRECASAAIVR